MSSTAHDYHRERHWACARRLGERRRALGLTQYEVVERLAALGVPASNRTVSAMEHGQGVDVGRLPEIAVALDCTITYLLGLTGDPQAWAPDASAAAANTTAVNGSGQRGSWILGPDIPESTSRAMAERRRA
jgi:transcriptional regulator with XRE-family HTH domain